MTKPDNIEIVDAEVLEEISNPDWDFEDKRRKKPKGTRKKDFTAFTEKVKTTILEALENGTPLPIAANAAGVALSTAKNWLERGEMAQEQIEEGNKSELAPIELDFAEFYSNCRQYSARAVPKILKGLMGKCLDNPHVALKVLEKISPEYFGVKQSIEMTGKVAHDHTHALVEGDEIAKRLSTEALRVIETDIENQEQLKQLESGEDDE